MTSKKSSRKWLFIQIQVLVEVSANDYINESYSEIKSDLFSIEIHISQLCSSSATRIDITCWTYLYHKVLPTPVSRHPNHSLHCCRKRWIALTERPWQQRCSSKLLFCACFYDGFINSNSVLEVISHPKEVYSDSTSGVVRFALLKGWNDLASYNKLLNLDTKIKKGSFHPPFGRAENYNPWSLSSWHLYPQRLKWCQALGMWHRNSNKSLNGILQLVKGKKIRYKDVNQLSSA